MTMNSSAGSAVTAQGSSSSGRLGTFPSKTLRATSV